MTQKETTVGVFFPQKEVEKLGENLSQIRRSPFCRLGSWSSMAVGLSPYPPLPRKKDCCAFKTTKILLEVQRSLHGLTAISAPKFQSFQSFAVFEEIRPSNLASSFLEAAASRLSLFVHSPILPSFLHLCTSTRNSSCRKRGTQPLSTGEVNCARLYTRVEYFLKKWGQ